MTFAAVLQRNRGLGPGFDFLRLALALSVVLFHSFQLTYGRSWSAGIFEPAVLLIVPAFFALSGFLVAGSMVRVRSVRTFIAFRALRIVPALAVEITLSALILGPLVTTLSLARYVSDPQFAIYFTNVLGWIHYHLPGVFLGNPLGGIVNGQLWTVPSELHCYILLAVLMVLRIATRPVLMLAVFVVLASAESATALLPGHHYDVRVLNSQEMLVLCFLCGNVFFLWREKIQANVWLFLASVLTFVGVFYLAPSLSFLVGVIAATYFITYLGMQRIPRVPVLMDGDYSYGVYLYSFALQQAVVWALPNQRVWWVNFAIGAPLALIVAALSWHGVEKPSLLLRKWLAPKTAIPRPILDETPAQPQSTVRPIPSDA